MSSMRDISNSVRRNQGSITAAQYLAGASSLLIPSRSKHYEVYTEASYCLSQLITFGNSVFLDNLYVDDNLSNVQNRAGGGVEETTRTDSNSLHASTVIGNKVCNNRGLDYYLWVMTHLVTHVEVLLEKAAGAFWGENSKERSLLILTIESIKAINRLFALLSSSNGKHTMILNWSKTYSSASDILDLNHYKLWYKVQNDRIHQEKIRAKLVLKSSKKEEIGIERDLFRREKSTLSSTTIDMNQETLFCTQFVGRRSGMVLNYSSGDEVIAALPSSSSSSSSPNATSTSSSALSSSPSSSEGSTTAVRAPTVFTSCPHTPTSPTASISPSTPSPSLPSPSPPSPTTSSPASPCESLSHSSSPSPSPSPTPTISSPSIPTIQEESASLLVSYYNAATCFPSSSSGITDDESTISTDSGTDNAEISTNGDINQNGDNNDNNEDLSNHLRNDEFDDNKNGNIHNNLYAISTIPLQNTIYNNYCTKYDIVSDTSYDKLNGNSNTNKAVSKYDGKIIPNKRKNKNHNKYENKQTNVACNSNENRITTDKQKESKDENKTDIENGYVNKIEEKCEKQESEERGDSSEVSRTQWCVSTPQKCQDIYTSLTLSHDMVCEDKFLESSQTSSSSSGSSSSSSSTAIDVRHVLESDREGDKEKHIQIDIDDDNNEKLKHYESSLIQPSSISTPSSDNAYDSNINNDINKSTQTERVYVFKSQKSIQNSNINSMIIKQKNTIEYPFTMEQALLVAEVLYVLRPVVYAWTVHYIQERKRKRSRNNEDELNSMINNAGAGVGVRTGGTLGGIRPSDSTNNSPSSGMRSDDAPASGKRGSGSDDPADEENSFFSSLEDFLPLLLSLVLEVSSIKLTCIALSMARESDKEEVQEEEDDGEGEVEEEVINGKRNQHYNKNSNNKNGINVAAYDSTSTHSCHKGPSKSPLNNPQRTKTTKYTQHKWDTELSRRKLLLLYYLVRGRTFNRATLPLLRSASELLRFIPIINSLPSYAISMLSYLNRSHFRSSASS